MKVIYISEALPFGHGEAFFVPEVEGLLARGEDLRIVPVRGDGRVLHGDARRLLPITWAEPFFSSRILMAALGVLVTSPISSLRALAIITRESRNWKVRIRNLLAYPKGLWLGREAKRWGADHLHACWTTWPATVGMVASEVSGVPWSFTAHSGEVLDDWLLKHKLDHAEWARFIAHSWLQIAVRAQNIPYPQSRIFVLRMGVELPAEPTVPRTDAHVLVCPAFFDPVKGHEYLFSALSRLRRDQNWELWLAGDGPLRSKYEQTVEALGITGRVRFLGVLSHDQLLGIYREGNVAAAVLPTLREGIPVALIEAMAHGVPVVSTTAGGIPELLWGEAGLMVPPEDEEALSVAIARILSEPDLRSRLSVAGRARIEESFAVDRVVTHLMETFKHGPTRTGEVVSAPAERSETPALMNTKSFG